MKLFLDESREELSELEQFVKNFAFVSGFTAAIIDLNGNQVSEVYNKKKIYPEKTKSPYGSIASSLIEFGKKKAFKSQTPYLSYCPNGLLLIVFPIIKKRHVAGYVICSEVQIKPAEKVPDFEMPDCSVALTEKQPVAKHSTASLPCLSEEQVISCLSLLATVNRYEFPFQPKSQLNFAIPQECQKSPEILKAVIFIKENLNGPLTLNDVANHVYLSQYYFSKLFKQVMKKNFVTYLNEQRIAYSKNLLLNSDLSIEVISSTAGYSQTSYFCKIFKELTSVTPAKFRKKYMSSEMAESV